MNKQPYQFMPVAAFNQAVEESAQVADAEAAHLEKLAEEIRLENAVSPRRGLKWRMEECLAGARAARRIAAGIRQALVETEEEN
jgi:hypothetical protein